MQMKDDKEWAIKKEKEGKFWLLRMREKERLFNYVRLIGIYRKIPKISPRAYIFRRPFLRGLFLEKIIYIRRALSKEGSCVSKSIGLAL